jgi:transcriptional regulator with XRE-family HTH domain
MEQLTPYDSSDKKSIAEPLRAIRLHRRLSQQALATRVGLPQYRVSLLERGVLATSAEIAALADALRVAPGALLDSRVTEAVGAALDGDA